MAGLGLLEVTIKENTINEQIQEMTKSEHRNIQMAPLFQAGIKNTGVGIPAVHQDIGTCLIWERAHDVQGHVDFRAVFRAATFQGIAQ